MNLLFHLFQCASADNSPKRDWKISLLYLYIIVNSCLAVSDQRYTTDSLPLQNALQKAVSNSTANVCRHDILLTDSVCDDALKQPENSTNWVICSHQKYVNIHL